jgi:hypothetical protein
MARESEDEWYQDYDNVTSFADVLIDIDMVNKTKDLQEYYKQPWKYDDEYAMWEKHDKPTSGKGLSDFVDELNEE